MSQCSTVAACSLDQYALDFEGNLRRVLESIRIAKLANATYRVGPELELCGYGCEDHFLETDTFAHSAEALAEILESGITDGILCDIGLPILHGSVSYNCRAFCLNGKILCIRPKVFLADDGNHRESRWFTRWEKTGQVAEHILEPALSKITGQRVVPFGDCVLALRDTKIAAESCEELFTPASPHIQLGLSGVEFFGNGSGSHHELRKLHNRVDLIKSATAKSGGVYLYSNQMGCDGGRLLYDGCAMIAVNGSLVAQGKQFSLADVDVVTADIDLDEVRAFRLNKASRNIQAASAPQPYVVHVDFHLCSGQFRIATSPVSLRWHSPEEEIAYGPACWLWDYLRRSGASGFFLPLSGGADSSSTAAIVGFMCQMVVNEVAAGNKDVLRDVRRIVGRDDPETQYTPLDAKELANSIFHTAYLRSENSSQRTQAFAEKVAAEIGCYHINASIDTIVQSTIALFVTVFGKRPQYRANGGTFAENQALQNIQARLRMLLSYFFAQLLPWVRGNRGWLLVLGSGNVDEGLRGYLTKYDCSSADLNPIGGISKLDLKRFLRFAASEDGLGYKTLAEIAEAPPSAELEPITESYTQTDEEDMGMTYAELSVYGRLRKVAHCGPVSMFKHLVRMWTHLSPTDVAIKVKWFFTNYTRNRHKATTMTPSVHCESYGVDDNRFDLRPILTDWRWPWQFNKIDELCKELDN